MSKEVRKYWYDETRPSGLYVDADDYDALQDLCDRLKQEAQIHAGEARSANATIAEIYQLVSDSSGEPGNWHGAEPVRAKLDELKHTINQLDRLASQTAALNEKAGMRVYQLEQALRELHKTAPRVGCECFHHAKADRHELDEECPPLRRYKDACSKANAALSQQPNKNSERP